MTLLRRFPIALVATLFTTLLTIGTKATPPVCYDPLGPEFDIAPTHLNRPQLIQRGNAIGVDALGKSVVGFVSRQWDPNGDPFFQRFDPTGMPVGSPALINPTLNGFDGPPFIEMAPDGRFVAVWLSLGLDGDGWGIFARLFDANATPLGPEFQVNTTTRGNQTNQRVGMDDHGNFVVLWTDRYTPTNEVSQRLRVFGANGTPLSGEVEVAQLTGLAWVDMASNGTILATWDTQPSNRYIIGRYYDLTGQPLSPAPFAIDADPSQRHAAPYVHATDNGGFVAVWQSYGSPVKHIHMRRLDPSVPSAGPRVEVSEFDYTEGYPVKVESLPDGRLTFLWQDIVSATVPFDIYARRFDATDQAVSPVFTVNEIDRGFERFPSLGLLPDGTLFAAWQSQTARGTTDSRVMARRFGCLNQPPLANAGADIDADCDQPGGALVTLNGTGSSDPDSDVLSFQWTVPEDAFGDPVAVLDDPTSSSPSGVFPLGDTLVTLVVTDPLGAFATDSVLVSVIDANPPLISCTTDLAVLWPPNHQMETVHITATVSDDCATPESLLVHCQVSSNEPDDGTGDGAFTGDVDGEGGFLTPVEVGLAYNPTTGQYEGTVALRAERDGAQSGRVYSIRCTAEDPSGNASETRCAVVVPKRRTR